VIKEGSKYEKADGDTRGKRRTHNVIADYNCWQKRKDKNVRIKQHSNSHHMQAQERTRNGQTRPSRQLGFAASRSGLRRRSHTNHSAPTSCRAFLPRSLSRRTTR